MATVNKPILLDETGKDMAVAIREQTEILSRATITMNPADYIVDCEYIEGEVTLPSGETITAVTSWYERYASGKVRQGGVWTEPLTGEPYQEKATIIFNIPMASSVYSYEYAVCTSDEVASMRLDLKRTATYFEGRIIFADDYTALQTPYVWQVEGMGAKL
jgi:hypothetical protein